MIYIYLWLLSGFLTCLWSIWKDGELRLRTLGPVVGCTLLGLIFPIMIIGGFIYDHWNGDKLLWKRKN